METAAHRCHIGRFLFRRFPQMMVHAAAAQTDSLSFLYVLQKKKESQRIRAAGNSSEDSTLYVTASPCLECSKLIIQAGIKRVVYKDAYRLQDGPDLLKKAGIEVEQVDVD